MKKILLTLIWAIMCSTAYAIKDDTVATVVGRLGGAQVVSSAEYNDFNEAINAISTEANVISYVTVYKNATLSKRWDIENAHVMMTVENGATLTVDDKESEYLNGINVSNSTFNIIGEGKILFKGKSYISAGSGSTVRATNITLETEKYNNMIDMENSNLYIVGSTFTCKTRGIYMNGGKCSITGATFNATMPSDAYDCYVVTTNDDAELSVSNVTFNCEGAGATAICSYGNTTIKSGTFNVKGLNSHCVFVANGETSIIDGTFDTYDGQAVYAEGQNGNVSTVYVKGGYYTATHEKNTDYARCIEAMYSKASVVISGGTYNLVEKGTLQPGQSNKCESLCYYYGAKLYLGENCNYYGFDGKVQLTTIDVTGQSYHYRVEGYVVDKTSIIGYVKNSKATRHCQNNIDFFMAIEKMEAPLTMHVSSDIEHPYLDGWSIDKDLTIELEKASISVYSKKSPVTYGSISVGNGVEVAINTIGNGSIVASEIRNYGELTINGGSYTTPFTNTGTMTINDGSFERPSVAATIIDAKSGKIYINGGLFSVSQKGQCLGITGATAILTGGTFTLGTEAKIYAINGDGSAELESGYVYKTNVDSEPTISSLADANNYSGKVVSSTPTAIEISTGDKNRSRAVKTVENGRVVIIRDGKRFDLSGRKL